MTSAKTLLWIGSPNGLQQRAVFNTPKFVQTFLTDIDQALSLVAPTFSACVIELKSKHLDIEKLARLCSEPGLQPVMVRIPTADPSLENALKDAGAHTVLVHHHHDDPTVLDEAIQKHLQTLEIKPSPQNRVRLAKFPEIVASSRTMKRALDLVGYALRSTAPVLLTGETGTGKEVLARAIHKGQSHSPRPFIAVNCAALPETLLESQLFGHAKGSFTGAERDRIGMFEAAHGGTLFLDEIGETSASLQAKLLRVLQEREVVRVGEHKARAIDIRLITATNRNLDLEIQNGNFRQDLYYRLAVFPIEVPPLRERLADIPILAAQFLSDYAQRDRKSGCHLSQEALHLLAAHTWPGNIRELQNEIQRVLAFSESGELILGKALSPTVRNSPHAQLETKTDSGSLKDRVSRYEAWLLRCELDKNAGHRTRTARNLGITREGLYKKMQRYGIR